MNTWIIFTLAMIFILLLWYIVYLRNNLKNLLFVLKEIRKGDNRKIFTMPKGLISKIGFEINDLFTEYQERFSQQSKLEQANREILTSLSHDVRTPLTSLMGYLDALESGIVVGEEKEKYIKIACKKAYELKSLVDTLFDWFKIGSKEMQLSMQKTDINELTREILIDWLPVLKQNGIEPKTIIPDEEYIVKLDKSAYTRIVSNLIQNAVEHGGGDCLEIAIERENCDVKIIILDNGKGIEQNKLPYIFDRLYKCDSARSRRSSGLGLCIVKGLVEIHGGIIAVESTLGKNTKIIIILPSV